jgi:hypothetical protein
VETLSKAGLTILLKSQDYLSKHMAQLKKEITKFGADDQINLCNPLPAGSHCSGDQGI